MSVLFYRPFGRYPQTKTIHSTPERLVRVLYPSGIIRPKIVGLCRIPICSHARLTLKDLPKRSVGSMHTKGLTFLVLLLLLCAGGASAQTDVATATLKGTITDQKGALVAGASVTATSTDKGLKRTATSDSEGEYSIALLPPGVYRVEIEAHGFAKAFNDEVR